MEEKLAIVSIIIEKKDSIMDVNKILNEFGDSIIGRMGLPYREKKISIISIAIDAPQDMISALAGKVGKLAGVSVKTAFSSVSGNA